MFALLIPSQVSPGKVPLRHGLVLPVSDLAAPAGFQMAMHQVQVPEEVALTPSLSLQSISNSFQASVDV